MCSSDLQVQLPLVLQVLLTGLVPCWAVMELRREAWRLLPASHVSLHLDVSGQHRLIRRDGRIISFEPRMIYCSELLLAVRGKTSDGSCHLMLPRDALLADDYRRLKVRLLIASSTLFVSQSSQA